MLLMEAVDTAKGIEEIEQVLKENTSLLVIASHMTEEGWTLVLEGEEEEVKLALEVLSG